jgi:YD repeat-containing protein
MISLLLTSVATVALAAVPVKPPPAAAVCDVSRLSEPVGWTMSITTGMDPGGRYIAGRGYTVDDPNDDFTRYPVIWDRGVPTPVDVPGIDQSIRDVNAAGVGVATSYDTDTWAPMTPWVVSGGVARPLPGIASGTAEAINASGVIVGNRADGVPLRWRSATAFPEKLAWPKDAAWLEVRDIDDDGTAVGFYYDSNGDGHAVAWRPDGSVRSLPQTGEAAAFAIRNGWIGGRNANVATRWRLPTGTTRSYPQIAYVAQGVNAVGSVVGSDLAGSAVLVTDAGTTTLPGLGGASNDSARNISDDGRTIAGQAVGKDDRIRAVRWDCK